MTCQKIIPIGAFLATVLLATFPSPLRADDQHPKISKNPAGYSLDWSGNPGRTYFVQMTTNLQQWHYFPEIYSGDGSLLSHGFNSNAPRLFTRLIWTDLPDGGDPFAADFDNDGLATQEELTSAQRTDPLNPDTDGDGLRDGWERTHGFNPVSTDSDGNGTPDGAEDPDGDGANNETEQNNDSDPNNAERPGPNGGVIAQPLLPVDLDIIEPKPEEESDDESGSETETETDEGPQEIPEHLEDWNPDTKKGGWAVALNWDDDDQDGGVSGHANVAFVNDFDDPDATEGEDDLIQLKVHQIPLNDVKGRVKFDTNHFRVWKNKNRTEELISETTEFDLEKDKDTFLFVEGKKITEAEDPKEIELQIKVGDEQAAEFIKIEEVWLHVATPIITFYGQIQATGGAGSRNLISHIESEEHLEPKRLDERQNPYYLRGKNTEGKELIYQIEVFDATTENEEWLAGAKVPDGDKNMKMALSTEDAHIYYFGHSNFGLGPNFETTPFDSIDGYMNITGGGLCSISIEELMLPHLKHGASENFSVNLADVPESVEGYVVDEVGEIKFPGLGSGVTATRKTPENEHPWHFENGPGERRVVVSNNKDLPELKYNVLFMGSCNTGRHFFESLQHGNLIYTKGETFGILGKINEHGNPSVEGDLLGPMMIENEADEELRAANGMSWGVTHFVKLTIDGKSPSQIISFFNQNQGVPPEAQKVTKYFLKNFLAE